MQSSSKKSAAGITLIELLVVVVIIGIISSIALPSYSKYIIKSKATTAAADLNALALNMENKYQLTLQYTAGSTATTALTKALFPNSWSPAQDANFDYTTTATSSTYTLTATGKASTSMNGCTLTLSQNNTRTASSACQFTTW